MEPAFFMITRIFPICVIYMITIHVARMARVLLQVNSILENIQGVIKMVNLTAASDSGVVFAVVKINAVSIPVLRRTNSRAQLTSETNNDVEQNKTINVM